MKTLEIVCGILHEGNKVLIARRKSKVHNNMWEFPGGKVEVNETRQQAVIRELQEELNYTCEVERYLLSIDDVRSDVILHVHAFLCNKLAGELQLNAHHEVKMVEVDKLYEYAFEKADQPILDALNAQMKGAK